MNLTVSYLNFEGDSQIIDFNSNAMLALVIIITSTFVSYGTSNIYILFNISNWFHFVKAFLQLLFDTVLLLVSYTSEKFLFKLTF